jgi:DNA-binding response OmpR family regulator
MTALNGLRILLVEDEILIAMMLEDVLDAAGCTIVGPFPGVEKAARAAREEAIDIALLDVNLGGELVYPIAETLAQRSVPFVFMTGYDQRNIPARYASRPVMGKPFKLEELLDKLNGVHQRGKAGLAGSA